MFVSCSHPGSVVLFCATVASLRYVWERSQDKASSRVRGNVGESEENVRKNVIGTPHSVDLRVPSCTPREFELAQ